MKKLMYAAILALCSATAYGMQPTNDQPQPSTQNVQQESDKNAQAHKNKYQQEVDTLIAQLNLNPHDYDQAQSWFARHKKQLLIGATVTVASLTAFLIWYLVKKRAAAEMLAQYATKEVYEGHEEIARLTQQLKEVHLRLEEVTGQLLERRLQDLFKPVDNAPKST
jgi:hypothetical protein